MTNDPKILIGTLLHQTICSGRTPASLSYTPLTILYTSVLSPLSLQYGSIGSIIAFMACTASLNIFQYYTCLIYKVTILSLHSLCEFVLVFGVPVNVFWLRH